MSTHTSTHTVADVTNSPKCSNNRDCFQDLYTIHIHRWLHVHDPWTNWLLTVERMELFYSCERFVRSYKFRKCDRQEPFWYLTEVVLLAANRGMGLRDLQREKVCARTTLFTDLHIVNLHILAKYGLDVWTEDTCTKRSSKYKRKHPRPAWTNMSRQPSGRCQQQCEALGSTVVLQSVRILQNKPWNKNNRWFASPYKLLSLWQSFRAEFSHILLK